MNKLYEVVQSIPSGKVTTYGALGRRLGINPRQVGRLLHQNIDPATIPCHRVVKSDGTLAVGYAFGGAEAQKDKLKKEGIVFMQNRIDLDRFGMLT